jgi:hypothetical protein
VKKASPLWCLHSTGGHFPQDELECIRANLCLSHLTLQNSLLLRHSTHEGTDSTWQPLWEFEDGGASLGQGTGRSCYFYRTLCFPEHSQAALTQSQVDWLPGPWNIFPQGRRSFPKGIFPKRMGVVTILGSKRDTCFLVEVGNPLGFLWVYGRGLLFSYCSGPQERKPQSHNVRALN